MPEREVPTLEQGAEKAKLLQVKAFPGEVAPTTSKAVTVKAAPESLLKQLADEKAGSSSSSASGANAPPEPKGPPPASGAKAPPTPKVRAPSLPREIKEELAAAELAEAIVRGEQRENAAMENAESLRLQYNERVRVQRRAVSERREILPQGQFYR